MKCLIVFDMNGTLAASNSANSSWGEQIEVDEMLFIGDALLTKAIASETRV